MIMRLITRISPRTIIGIATAFATIVSELITNIGPIRTIRILLGIRQALNFRASTRVLRDILTGRADTITIENIVRILDPEWVKLVKNNVSFSKIINAMLFVTSIILFIKPFITITIRTFFICFFAIFGIIYTPLHSTYKFFRELAIWLLSFIPQSLLNFFPRKVKVFYDKYNSSWFSWIPSIWKRENKSKIDDIKQAAFGFGESVFHEEKSWWDKYKYYVYGALSIISLFFILDLFKPDAPVISDVTNFFRKSFNFVSSSILSVKSLVFYPITAISDYFSKTHFSDNLYNKIKNWFVKNESSVNIPNVLNENTKIAIDKIQHEIDLLNKYHENAIQRNSLSEGNNILRKMDGLNELANQLRDGRVKIDNLAELQFHLDNLPRPGEPSGINNSQLSQSSENSQIEINDQRNNNSDNSIIKHPTPIRDNPIDLHEIDRISNDSQKAFSFPSTPIIENAVIPPAPPAPPVPAVKDLPIQQIRPNNNALLDEINKKPKLRSVITNDRSETLGIKKPIVERNLKDDIENPDVNKNLNKVPTELINDTSAPNTSGAKTIIPDTRNEPLPGTSSSNPLTSSLSKAFDTIRTANSSPEIEEAVWYVDPKKAIPFHENEIIKIEENIFKAKERLNYLTNSSIAKYTKSFSSREEEIGFINNRLVSLGKTLITHQEKLAFYKEEASSPSPFSENIRNVYRRNNDDDNSKV